MQEPVKQCAIEVLEGGYNEYSTITPVEHLNFQVVNVQGIVIGTSQKYCDISFYWDQLVKFIEGQTIVECNIRLRNCFPQRNI